MGHAYVQFISVWKTLYDCFKSLVTKYWPAPIAAFSSVFLNKKTSQRIYRSVYATIYTIYVQYSVL